MKAWLAAVPLLLAAASDKPLSLPTRDVDVTYRVPVPEAPAGTSLLQRYRWSAAARVQRLDLPTSGTWMTVDFTAHRMVIVREAAHEAIEQPAPPGMGPGLPNAGDAARAGAATVANLPCTEWRTRDLRGREVISCVTDDGVLLRARAGDRTLLEAVTVSFAPQDPTLFQVPPGFTRSQAATP